MKILHIAYQSLPNVSGSSIRTRDIVMSQKQIGLDPIVITSPFQNGLTDSNCDLINDIKHYRTYNNKPEELVSEVKSSVYKRIKKSLSFVNFFKQVKLTYLKEKPDVVHAHATFYCAFAALYLKYRYSVCVVYEIRSLWEERELKTAKSYIDKIQPKLIRKIETIAMKRADVVVAINNNLKENLFKRGVKSIKVVPNAVNLSLLKEKSKSSNRSICFGYIGSVSPIEGLNLVAKVWHNLEKEGFNNEFHIFGEGSFTNELKETAKYLKLTNFIFHGVLDSSEIFEAFNKIDVIVNPRLKSKISDTVTPLKPLEAMAYKKLVIVSDVGGMKELVTHQKTGLLFEHDSVDSLEKVIKQVIKDGVNQEIVNNAFNYVNEEKSWLANAQIYKSIYLSLKK